jgi:hypothetical protein
VSRQFFVDGNWRIDQDALQENDGHNNVNNVLLPQHIKKLDQPTTGPTAGQVATEMSGVTPEAPAESGRPVFATISSAAPDSTTAELAKDVPLEHSRPTPGTFPETPAKEPEQFSVNPLPATAGIGNPIQLKPGEAVPDPSTLTQNTITSTVTTDKAGYERDASAPGVSGSAPVEKEDIVSEPSMEGPGPRIQPPAPISATVEPNMAGTAPIIQPIAPTSTTAALAGAVPLEAKSDVPETPAQDIPEVVKESIIESHQEPEAAGSAEAVAQKKEVEEELLKEVKIDESVGTPGPTATAETAEAAPAPTKPIARKDQVRDLSPKSKEPATAPEEATAPTGASEAAPAPKEEATAPATEKKKKKNRASLIFQKLKEKLK